MKKPQLAPGAVHAHCFDLPGGADDRCGGLHRVRRRSTAANPGAICEARCRPPRHGRAIFVLAAPRQFRRRDSSDFCEFAAGVPATIALLFGGRYQFITDAVRAISFGEPLYNLVYVLMIILFAFFYIGIVFNPTELADNMRKNGGFIPGIRPGRTTSEHVSKILKRLTFIGAIYLCLVCLLPEWLITGIHLDHVGWGIGSWFDRHFPAWFLKGLGVQFYFGGTSLLIVVGVAMDTVQQLEAQLVMRNYEGLPARGGCAAGDKGEKQGGSGYAAPR